ncbi:hypothetical protein [Nitrosomonas communis]|uniref:hypothetical protein n=1 Tax=Nitrosomonas communis TaxID=44574 RepID=UPI0026EB10EF|nr:hypothetical protein [Nitrosomonas communis]
MTVDQGEFRRGTVCGHGHDLDWPIGFGVAGRDPDMRLADLGAGIILSERHWHANPCQQAGEEIANRAGWPCSEALTPLYCMGAIG